MGRLRPKKVPAKNKGFKRAHRVCYRSSIQINFNVLKLSFIFLSHLIIYPLFNSFSLLHIDR